MKKLFIFVIMISLVLVSAGLGQDLKIYSGHRTLNRNDIPGFVGYVPDAIVVQFKSSVARTFDPSLLSVGKTGNRKIDAFNHGLGVKLIEEMFPNARMKKYEGRSIELSGYYRLTINLPTEDIEDVVARYRALAEVVKVEPIGIHTVDAIPNDDHFPDQWHLNQSNDHDIDAPEAWDIEAGNDQIVVSIFDTGVRYFHKDLGGPNASYTNPATVEGNMWINWTEKNGAQGVDDDGNGFVDDWIGWDFVHGASNPPVYPCWSGEDCNDPDNDPRDFNGHGTHCAGNVGAINNNSYATCAPSGGWGGDGNGVKVMACRIGWSVNVLNKGYELGMVRMDFAAQAFHYAADNGARIVSCSWGSSNSGGIADAINYFLAAGGMIFKSAGNSSSTSADYMSSRSDIISVAATDQNDCAASFTNYGSWVDISAPGVGIWSLYHNHNDPQNDYVASMDGTSMASPLAASVAALIWSQNPGWSASQVQQKLYDSADNIDNLPCNSSYAGNLGAGRINAYNAISGGQPTPPSITINDVSVTEGNSGTVNANFTVTLSKAADQEVRVDYATANGTATAGSDYVATSNTLVFPVGGSLTQTITIPVYGDQVVESDETFFVNLSNAVNATIADNQGRGTIRNDDVTLSLSINDVSQSEGNSGTTNFIFTVTLSATPSQEVRVDYATANGTATAGSDYIATAGTLGFPAGGATTQTVVVQVYGDVTVEDNETFVVNLSNPVNATITDNQGQGTIQNDDSAGNFMHVNDVKVTKVNLTSRLSYGKAEVQIVDRNGSAVANATVTGQWTEGASGTATFTTGSNGWGSTQSSNNRNVSRYCFRVTNVTRTDWTYESSANVETWACSDGSAGLNMIPPKSEPGPGFISEIEEALDEDVVFSYPNPFNSTTAINFYLPEPGKVTVEIYNLLGEKIATVLDQSMNAGLNQVTWNGTAANGTVVSAGHYFFKIRFPDGEALTRRMLMLK